MTTERPPQPAGPEPGPLPEIFSLDDVAPHIQTLADAPRALREAVAGLDDAQLDTKYINWTIRQIVHHLPDSHTNCYIRFMWTLTEDTPRIKAYNESDWSRLSLCRTGPIDVSLALMDAIHAKLVGLMRSMSVDDFSRSFDHPEYGKRVRLADATAGYAWHARHHTLMINWLREHHGWA